MSRSVHEVIVKLTDQATRQLKGVQGQIDKTLTKTQNFIKQNEEGIRSIRNASGVALAGVVALGTGAIMQASKMQALRQNFDTLLGSAEKGKKLFLEIQKMAALTPFTSSDLASATSTMLGFGVAEERVLPLMKQLGDISMGNSERFQALSLAFAQVSAAGKLTGQDLLQMVNAGFNPLQEISKQTGKSISQLKDEMADGAITVKMIEDAMRSATGEGGRFAGGMDKASKTFSGVMSTFRDNIGITLASIAGFSNGEVVKGGLLDVLTKAMTKLMPHLDRFAQWASKNGTTIGLFLGISGAVAGLTFALASVGLIIPNVVLGFNVLMGIGKFIGIGKALAGTFSILKTSLLLLGTGVRTFMVAIGPVGWALLAIGAIITLLTIAWKKNWGDIQGKTKAAVTMIQGFLEGMGAWIYDFVQAAKEWGGNLIKMMIDGIKAKFADFKNAILGVAGIIGDYLGFHSPTKKGPGSDSDTWMPNLIDMLVDGIDSRKATLQKAAEDLAKSIGKGFSKERFEALRDNIVNFMENAQNVFYTMGDNIKNQKDKIKGLRDEYKELGKQLKDIESQITGLGQERSATLADRAYQIQKEITSLQAEEQDGTQWLKIENLQKELEFIRQQGITEKEIIAAKELANRTEAQKIIDDFAKRAVELQDKKDKIQEEMQAKSDQIADEKKKYSDMVKEKIRIEKEYRKLTHTYFQEQLSETQQLINAMKSLEEARRSAQGPVADGIAGARALGGPVRAGSTYLVGERGPELFTAPTSGTIIPNNKLGGGVSVTITVPGGVHINNGTDFNTFADRIKSEVVRAIELSRLKIA